MTFPRSDVVDFSHKENLSIYGLLEDVVKTMPGKTALIYRPVLGGMGQAENSPSERERLDYSFAQLKVAVDNMALRLAAYGVGVGDRVALWLPNWPEFVQTYFAVARLGAILVPLNIRYRSHELAYMLNDSGAKVLICPGEYQGVDYADIFAEMRSRTASVEHVYVVQSPGVTFDLDTMAMLSFDHAAHDEKYLASQRAPQATIDPANDTFSVLYTSGTTGTPKGAMLSHANIVRNSVFTARLLECTPDDVILAVVPLFHIFGMSPTVATATVVGAPLVLVDAFKPEAVLRIIAEEKVSVHHGVPTMFILELGSPALKRYDVSSLRTGIIAAAPCPVEVVRRINRDMHCNITISYGLTETSPLITATRFDDPEDARLETVGRAASGIDIKIVNDDGEEVKNGEVGELAARGYAIMQGYWRAPDATRAAIDSEGWFFTGDLATIDERGYVRIVGRKKEMIVRGGFKIYPREVEEIYYGHPKVQEAAIIGLPDPVLGEKSVAFLKLKPNEDATVDEMRDFVRSRIADFKVPDVVRFVDAFPMTSSGKIKKMQMRAEMLDK